VCVPILHHLRGLFRSSRGSAAAPTHVRRLERPDDLLSGEVTLVERLADGDSVLCVPGDVIPCRGIVIDGFAVVRRNSGYGTPNDEAPLPLRAGSRVIPGMAVVSNFLIVRVRSESA
jgi:high-affinity K+ transport system ATPase subunit B